MNRINKLTDYNLYIKKKERKKYIENKVSKLTDYNLYINRKET